MARRNTSSGFKRTALISLVDIETEEDPRNGNTITAANAQRTRAQIVARLQEAEAEAWLDIARYDCSRAPVSSTDRERLRWEATDTERRILMAAWYSLRVLMEELNIHTAKNLPQHIAAKALVDELSARRKAGSGGITFTLKS